MSTMNISLPGPLKAYIDEQIAERGYGTVSEYLGELIRKDQDRQALRRLILDGAAAPVTGEADAAWFESLREGVRRHPE
jgi:antitoxin ParD1/3/4